MNRQPPFALSLSKGVYEPGFDKLSPNGFPCGEAAHG